jgi:type IV secretory pathway VirJ component
MIRRYLRFLLAALLIVVLGAVAYWLWNRPAAQPTLEHITLDDGSALIRVVPSTKVKTQVALAVTGDESMTEKQLLALSYDASARVIQVTLPKDDCQLQAKTFNAALQKLDGAPDLVAGIGPGASLAWRWLAGQSNDNAQAISVGFVTASGQSPGTTARTMKALRWYAMRPTPKPASAITTSSTHKC